jgi:hypothetical protein
MMTISFQWDQENDNLRSKLQNNHYSCIILDFTVNNNSPCSDGQARRREFDSAVTMFGHFWPMTVT